MGNRFNFNGVFQGPARRQGTANANIAALQMSGLGQNAANRQGALGGQGYIPGGWPSFAGQPGPGQQGGGFNQNQALQNAGLLAQQLGPAFAPARPPAGRFFGAAMQGLGQFAGGLSQSLSPIGGPGQGYIEPTSVGQLFQNGTLQPRRLSDLLTGRGIGGDEKPPEIAPGVSDDPDAGVPGGAGVAPGPGVGGNIGVGNAGFRNQLSNFFLNGGTLANLPGSGLAKAFEGPLATKYLGMRNKFSKGKVPKPVTPGDYTLGNAPFLARALVGPTLEDELRELRFQAQFGNHRF